MPNRPARSIRRGRCIGAARGGIRPGVVAAHRAPFDAVHPKDRTLTLPLFAVFHRETLVREPKPFACWLDPLRPRLTTPAARAARSRARKAGATPFPHPRAGGRQVGSGAGSIPSPLPAPSRPGNLSSVRERHPRPGLTGDIHPASRRRPCNRRSYRCCGNYCACSNFTTPSSMSVTPLTTRPVLSLIR